MSTGERPLGTRARGARVRIGLVADTHVGDGLPHLPPEVPERLAGCDLILHAGDLCRFEVLDELGRVAPTMAVRGNHDARGGALPRSLVLAALGRRVGLVHGDRSPLPELWEAARWVVRGGIDIRAHVRALLGRTGAVDALLMGHLHVPVHGRAGGALVFSPGAVYQAELDPGFRWDGPRHRAYALARRALPPMAVRPAVGIVEVTRSGVRATRVLLERPIHPDGPAPAGP